MYIFEWLTYKHPSQLIWTTSNAGALIKTSIVMNETKETNVQRCATRYMIGNHNVLRYSMLKNNLPDPLVWNPSKQVKEKTL